MMAVNRFVEQTGLQGDRMQSDFLDVERRVKRYWYTDGIGELIGGGTFILLGIYFALQEYLGDKSLISAILQSSFALLFIGGAILSRWLVNILKARLTYPRTGYIEYQVGPRGTAWRRIWVIGLASIAAVLAMVFVRLFQFFDSMVAFTGLIAALIFVAIGAKSSGIIRFYILGVVSLVLGLVLSMSRLPNGYSLGLLYGVVGVCACIFGGLTLRRYLQENPLPADMERQNG